MKKILSGSIMIFIICSGIMAQSGSKSKSLKPKNSEKTIPVVVSGKTINYYSLGMDHSSVVTATGPGKLRVITRGQFKPEEVNKLQYTLLYTVDGGKQKSVTLSAVDRSTKAKYASGITVVPGEIKDFTIALGRGDHSIEFKMKDNKVPVAARFVFTPVKEKKRDWILYAPLAPSEPVDLVSREKTVSYTRFSKNKPLKVEIIGPTELRVMTRVENHYEMKGRIHYRVQVKEGDVIINTFQLGSERSETAFYKENKELVPGKACEFVINVPKGKHTYSIYPLDEDKSTILGRLLLLKKDVKLENK